VDKETFESSILSYICLYKETTTRTVPYILFVCFQGTHSYNSSTNLKILSIIPEQLIKSIDPVSYKLYKPASS